MLRIVGKHVDPNALTKALGISPTLKYAPWQLRHPRGQASPEGAWAVDTESAVDSTDLEIHIKALLDLLPPDFGAHVPPNSRCELLCVWRSATGHGGPIISAEVLTRLGTAGIELGFDFYSDVGDLDVWVDD